MMGVENAGKTALWTQRMEAFESSGQARRAWCKTQGLEDACYGVVLAASLWPIAFRHS